MSKGVLRQLLVAICGSIGAFCGGCAFTWFSPFIVPLTRTDSDFRLTMTEVSLVLSMLDIGSLISPLPIGFLVDRFGRKPILVFGGPMFILSWIVVLSNRSIGTLYFGRLLQGMSLGVVFSVLPMYLGEICEKDVRGRISLFIQVMVTLGMAFEYILGSVFNYNEVLWISAVPPLLFSISFFWFPESPYYLVMKGRWKEAKESLQWLRGSSDILDEMEEVRQSVEEEKQVKASWKDIFRVAKNGKLVVALESVLLAYELGGAISVMNYASLIFSKISGGSATSDVYPILLCSLIFLFIPITFLMIERLGRRPLILTSTLIAAIANLASSIYFFFILDPTQNSAYLSWIPYLTIILSTVSLVCGVESVKHVLQAELFPNSTRGVAGGITIFSERFMSVISITLFPIIISNSGLSLVFLIFFIFCILSFVGIALLLPETKGRSLTVIQKSIQ